MSSSKKQVLRRKRQNSKKKNFSHVLKRAKDRFGLRLTKAYLNELTHSIKVGRGVELIKTEIRQSGPVEWHKVILPRNTEAVALFDRRLNSIRTIMPVDKMQKENREIMRK